MKGKYLDPKADLTYRERVFFNTVVGLKLKKVIK